MARKWSNLNIPGALHFVTGNVHDRDQLFQAEFCCQEFFAILGDLKSSWPAKLIAHVLMPDHFHLIANPRDGDIQGFIGALKSKLSMDHRADWRSFLTAKTKSGWLYTPNVAGELQSRAFVERLDDPAEDQLHPC